MTDPLIDALYGRAAVAEMRQRDLAFGRFLVARGLVARAALAECLADLEASASAGARLRNILIRRRLLTSEQVDQAVESMDALPHGVPVPSEENAFGQYVLVEKIGSGGMGDVWKAWDGSLGRHVALKFLRADDPHELARFRREAELCARLTHPGIAVIHEMASAGGRHFLAMQYVQGTTLEQAAKLGRKVLVGIVRDAARAVDWAHKQGIVHRDLKPSNIMASPRGEGRFDAVVLDFGLARKIEGGARVTASGSVVGTPAYMSPEQARGGQADVRSDVYGLGATTYEVLTGHPPFEGTHVFELLRKVEGSDPLAPRRWDRTIDTDREPIVVKCLEKDPSKRYRSAGAFADDLDRWLEGEPIVARAPSLAYRVRKRLAKRKALAALVVVAILLGGAAALLGMRASSAEARMLVELRKQTQTSLLAVLEVRRAGRTEQMKPFVEGTEEACRSAIALLPRKAEPHYRLGRMYRAVMDDARALEEQNQALAREPAYGPALYERSLLLARAYRRRVEELVPVARALEGKRLAERGEGRGPDWRALAAKDPQAMALMARMRADLEGLERGSGELNEGERLFARGLAAWAERHDPKAVKLLTAALAAGPGLEEAYEALAKQHGESERHEEAVRVWSEGLDRDRGYLPHVMGRGRARFEWANARARRGEDPVPLLREAAEDYGEALKRDPRVVEAWDGRASARANLGGFLNGRGEDPTELYREATDDYAEALRRDTGRVSAWSGRGIARTSWGSFVESRGGDPSEHYRGAIDDFDEALKRDSEDVESREGRGHARMRDAGQASRRGEDPGPLWRAAIEDFTEALRRDPQSIAGWEGRGYARSNLGIHAMGRGEDPSRLYAGAIADFAEAQKRGPRDAEPWTGRGGARMHWAIYRMQRGEDPVPLWQAAIEDYGEALTRNAGLVLAWRWRGNARLNLALHIRNIGGDPSERLREAIEDYGEALKRNPSSAEALEARGDARVHLGLRGAGRGEDPSAHYDAALEDFARAIAVNRRTASHWHLQGHAYRHRAAHKASQGVDAAADYRAALASYEEALRLNARLGPQLRPFMAECKRHAEARPQE